MGTNILATVVGVVVFGGVGLGCIAFDVLCAKYFRDFRRQHDYSVLSAEMRVGNWITFIVIELLVAGGALVTFYFLAKTIGLL